MRNKVADEHTNHSASAASSSLDSANVLGPFSNHFGI